MSEKPQCPECGPGPVHTDPSRGESICGICGLVIEEKNVDTGPEWRAFSSIEEKARARTGSPTTLTVHDKGLSTMIDWRDRDAHGNKLDPKMRAKIYRIRKWQIRTRVHSSIDRNLAHAMSELDRLSSQLSIPRGVKEAAAMIYRKAIDKKLIRGRSIEAMVGASIYASCRGRKIPRTLDEISKYSRIKKKELGRCYRLLLRELDIKIPLASPIDFITRFGAELHVSGIAQRNAIDILKRAKKFGITVGKDPTGLAAAALYISTLQEGERRTQREIAEVAHVTEVTVRNRYKELAAYLKIEIAL
ncbi:MAG: transcription initiation factor IIB [Candidatus Hodarchaeota archaeon]